jgi:hypothetical protein
MNIQHNQPNYRMQHDAPIKIDPVQDKQITIILVDHQ